MSRYCEALKSHQHCVVCGDPENNPWSLGLVFEPVNDHTMHAQFEVRACHQGYNGLLHGGIASSIADAAMTHCLLAQGIRGLTAELNVRFHHPIKLGDTIQVIGEIVKTRRKMYVLSATLLVNDIAAVSATGKFIEPKS